VRRDVRDLKAKLVNELKCRPEGQAVDIPALVEDYGAEALEALRQLRRGRVVRLLAAGSSVKGWLEANGYSRDQVIDGEGEVFIQVELRKQEAGREV
jgi:hypothetical protein